MNTKIYKSPNEKSRPVGGAHGFGPFGLIQKIPPGQFWIFDHIIILLMQMIYCFISFLLQVPTSYEPGSESCRVPRHDSERLPGATNRAASRDTIRGDAHDAPFVALLIKGIQTHLGEPRGAGDVAPPLEFQ